MKQIILIFISLSICFASYVDAAPKLDVDLQNVSLTDALHFLAKGSGQNIIISPQVKGNVSLYLADISSAQALNLVLQTHHLSKKVVGSTLYILPQEELLRELQQTLKLQTSEEEVAAIETHFWPLRYAKAEDITQAVQSSTASLLSKRGQIHSDSRTNVLCIQDTASHLLQIERLITRMDVPVQQVLIEARLASIDSDFERELGINFSVAGAATNSVSNNFTLNQALPYSLAVAKMANGSLLDVQLSALEAKGHGELISSPSLFTTNQKPASIEAGEEIPYQEISKSGATGVAFKKAVLSLKVTPQIMPGNKVLLQLQVNQDKPNNRMVLGVPAISTRQIMTTVLVDNAQTIVLGGIYETNQEKNERGLPFLNKIPLVASLLTKENISHNKRELLIFVTPKIIWQTKVPNDKGKT